MCFTLSLKKIYSLNLASLFSCHLISLPPFPAKLLTCLWGPSPLAHLSFFLRGTHLAFVCTPPCNCSCLGPQIYLPAAKSNGQFLVIILSSQQSFSTEGGSQLVIYSFIYLLPVSYSKMQLPADGDLVYLISGCNPGAYSGTCHMADVE